MARIDSVKESVFLTLKRYPETRNDDRLLVLRVYEDCFGASGADSFESVLFAPDLPGFETIRRTRQKIQAERPELRADKYVEALRAERETEFREFARS